MWLVEAAAWLGTYLFPTETGRFLVRAVSLGYARCEDDVAWVVGTVFWQGLFVAGAVAVYLVGR